MIYFLSASGGIAHCIPGSVYQGSAEGNTLYLVSPHAASAEVSAAFRLPDGTITPRCRLEYAGILEGYAAESGTPVCGWRLALPASVTAQYGTVRVQFYFLSAGQGQEASASAQFTVERGVPSQLPSAPEADAYADIVSALTALRADLINGYYAARAAVAWNDGHVYGANELVFYPAAGTHGAIMQSKVSDNAQPPYTDGALNTQFWETVVSFDTIADDFFADVHAERAAAEAAKTAAESARSAAETAGQNAKQSETVAQGYAGAASGSAGQAASAAEEAAGSATAAAQSAGSAAQSAGEAQASANRAQAIADGLGAVYKPGGSIPYAQLPAAPTEAEHGYVYNISDSFTTDSRFVEGAGLRCAAGTNVAVVLNGSQYMYDVQGAMADLTDYAQIDGSYPDMSVGSAAHAGSADSAGSAANATNADHASAADSATNANHAATADSATNANHAAAADSATKAAQDGDGNDIAATYAKQSGTYPNLTAGSAQKVAPAGQIDSGAKLWWDFLHVRYSGSAVSKAVLNEVFLVNGLLDYTESSDTHTEAAALLQLQAVYLPQTNAWKEYSLVYLNGDIPYTRFCVYADAEGLHVSQYGTQSEMNLVPLSSKSSGFTVSYAGGPATPPEERKEPEVLLPMLNGAARVYTYNGSDFTAQAGDSYIIDEPNIVTGGNTLAVGDLVQDASGTILRLTTVNDGSGLAIGTVLGRYIPYYSKPHTGIPKSHLAQAVQTSLGKADTALQSAPVTSVAGKTGAVTLAKGDVGLSNVDNVQQYSASNPPPYPVSSVNGQTGAVNLTTADAEVLSGLAFDENFGKTSGNIVGYRIGDLVVISVVFTPGSSGIAWRDWALATGLPLPRVEGSLNPNPQYVGTCIPATPCALSADGITDVQFNLRVYEGSSRLWIHRCTTTNGASVGAGIEFYGTIVYVCQ